MLFDQACDARPQSCEFWTWNPSNDFCIFWADCPNVVTGSCPDCVSGRRDCNDLCDQPYECKSCTPISSGPSTSYEDDLNDCARECANAFDCQVLTYYYGTGLCTLCSECDEIGNDNDPFCDCVTTKPECGLEVDDCEVNNSCWIGNSNNRRT